MVDHPGRGAILSAVTSSADIRFEVEVHLTSGMAVNYHVPTDRVSEIVSRPNWDWPAGIPDDSKAFASVFSDIALRVSKGTGFLQAEDLDGRAWLIRADSIVAFSVKDYHEPAEPRPMGFIEIPIKSR